MNIETGITRLAKVVKWFGYITGGCCTLGGLVVIVLAKPAEHIVDSAFLVVLGIVVALVFWCVSWVLEGFGKN